MRPAIRSGHPRRTRQPDRPRLRRRAVPPFVALSALLAVASPVAIPGVLHAQAAPDGSGAAAAQDNSLGVDATASGAAGADSALSSTGPDAGAEAPEVDPVTDPQTFADVAGSSGLFEIAAAKLALERSQDPAVRDFAQMMITDHGQAAEGLKTAAAAQKVTVPEKMADAESAMMVDLNSATDFDTLYINDQVKAHEVAVAQFQSFSNGGPDGALKDFAGKTLPVLKTHEDAIRKIAGDKG